MKNKIAPKILIEHKSIANPAPINSWVTLFMSILYINLIKKQW